MGQVTLRDLSTNEDIVVPPEGYIFGRVGGDADIQIEDNSISRRQARVSLKGGMWLLETLAVPQGAKAPRPVQLQEGASFTVGQSEFEVVQIEQEEDEPAAPTIAPSKSKPGPAPIAGKKPNPPPSNAKTAPSAPQQKRAPTANAAAAAPADGGGDEEPAAGGVKALFAGVPKGIAYYLVNVPKLLVNPVGTVRKQIEELPAEPMGKTALIGYSVPSLFISFSLPSIAGGIGSLIGPGHHFNLLAFVPIIPAIIAAVGSVVWGFIFHPVFEWVINKLKGHSDARSRSNYFLQMMTLGIVLAVPSAVAALVAPIPYVNVLLAPLLSVVSTLVTFYVGYQWLVKFDVVKVLLTVMKVLAVLALLGTGFGFVNGILTIIRGGGGAIAAVPTADTGGSELGDVPPSDPEEAAEWAKKKQAEAMAKVADAQKKAAAAVEDAKDQADDAKEAADDAVKTAKKDAPPKPEKPEPAKPEPHAEPAKPEPVAVKDTPPPPTKDEPVASPSGAYSTFARRRDAIEKLFENDPTVLAKSADLQKLYTEYSEDAFEIEKRYGKESAKKPERTRLNNHLRDAELFTKTGKTIDAMAAKLGIK